MNDLSALVDEYSHLNSESNIVDWSHISGRLKSTHGWTDEGANAVSMLVRKYGSFVLRNAAAMALALNHEDGGEFQL